MTEFYNREVIWRDTKFDSILEMNWCASMVVWGVNFQYHPATLLLEGGELWQPDFLLREAAGPCQDILLEVKGDHDERIHKPQIAQEMYPDLTVLIGREYYLRADHLNTIPGAVWHRPDGSDYEWDLNGNGKIYVSAEYASEESPGLLFYRGLESTRKIK